jgi:hypothetical protein
MKALLAALLLVPVVAQAAIGSITEQAGSSEIKRGKSAVVGKKDVGIESDDSVNVASNSEVSITFRDNTRVKIKANSRLVIDDFVFDPKKSDAGKMAMKVAMGTVQYASGQIAKNNRQNMNIKTPTATIAVRGTDFAMTVDEAGRSLVVLLPSCQDPREINRYEVAGNCTVGQIDVETAAGFVSLNQPFTATFVSDAQQAPLAPVPVAQDIALINNDQVLRPPELIAEALQDREDRKKNRSRKGDKDDEERAAQDSSDSKNKLPAETTIIATAEKKEATEVEKTNNCWPFNSCGNEKGLNWYYRVDEERGNVIHIASGERMDNTTYNISINSVDMQTRVTGDGSNKVTVRIWNR